MEPSLLLFLPGFFSFLLMGFAGIPLLLRLFTILQAAVGNEDRAFVQTLKNNERRITFGVWIFFGIGLMISLPRMLADLFGIGF